LVRASKNRRAEGKHHLQFGLDASPATVALKSVNYGRGGKSENGPRGRFLGREKAHWQRPTSELGRKAGKRDELKSSGEERKLFFRKRI